ncbi:YhbY family RNA-binding protein [Candidatus Izemoplasma sp. B36]|uniref:YhbY family RNA-binding protein n=1 Tax=Candidatus Izemoplasma sp. B36 TaxID=3242468 RepID=UPI00355769ED
MNYTGKQKAKLRSLANKHKVMFQIGQNGLTDNVINNIFDYLRKHEVGRITVLKTSPIEIDEVMYKLNNLGIDCFYKIGKIILMYKENVNLKDRIKL